MGRFRIVHDDDDSEQEDRHWEFVAEGAGEEGAMVVREEVVALQGEENGGGVGSDSGAQDNEPCLADDGTSCNRRRHNVDLFGRAFQRHATNDWETVPYPNAGNEWEWVEPERRSTRWSSFRSWFWIISFVIVFIALLWKDPPPAPPPSNDNADAITISWNEYFGQHGPQLKESATALGLHTPRHILSWLVTSVYTDLLILYERFQQQRQPKCRLIMDSGLSFLQNEMVGQSMAVETLVESRYTSGPWVVWAIGYPHTGKRTLARKLASQIVDNCGENSLLQIKGSDWRIEEYYDLEARNKLVERDFQTLASTITTHIQRYGFAVIVLVNVEEMAPEIFRRIMESLESSCERSSKPDDNKLNLREICGNSIVYLTTSTGKSLEPITRSLRVSGQDLRKALALPADIRDAVGMTFGVDSRIATMLPFGPFTPDLLADLLRQRVSDYSATQTGVSWKRLKISDAAVKAFLDPSRVEYLEWRSRVTGETNSKEDEHFMTVALEGASILDDRGSVMSKIYAQTKQMVQQGAQPSKVAVLDYESTNPFASDEHRGLLKWCDDSPQSKCKKISRFRI